MNWILYMEIIIFLSQRGNYNLSGIWINGNTGEIKEVKTNENIKILLAYNSHMPYMRRIEKDKEEN